MAMLSVIPSRRALAATKDNEIYVAVRLTAPKLVIAKRPPIAIAVAIDISSSMAGDTGLLLPSEVCARRWGMAKLDLVKFGLAKLIDSLESDDLLAIIAFDDRVSTPLALTRMDENGKHRAHRAVDLLAPRGSTNLSGGLYEALQQLKIVDEDMTKRVMLFTDGEANYGDIHLQSIQRGIQARTRTPPGISTFGFGMTYNSELLGALATGGGSHYYIKDPELLPVSFGTEIGSLASLYGRDVELSVTPAEKVEILEVLNDLQVADNVEYRYVEATVSRYYHVNGKRITCDNLYSEQTYNVVLKLRLPKRRTAKTPQPVLTVTGKLTDVATNGTLSFTDRLELTFGTVRAADTTDNADVMSAVAVQLAAKAQKEASELARQGDIAGGRMKLLRSADQMKSLGRSDLGMVAKGLADEGYASMNSYKSVGQKMSASIGSTYSKQTAGTGGLKSGGVDVDNLFANSTQRKMANTFSITKTAGSGADDMPDVDCMVTP